MPRGGSSCRPGKCSNCPESKRRRCAPTTIPWLLHPRPSPACWATGSTSILRTIQLFQTWDEAEAESIYLEAGEEWRVRKGRWNKWPILAEIRSSPECAAEWKAVAGTTLDLPKQNSNYNAIILMKSSLKRLPGDTGASCILISVMEGGGVSLSSGI